MYTETNSGFYDLCINAGSNESQNLETVLSKLQKLGFGTVAINVNIDESILGTDKRKKKKGNESESLSIVPEPIDIETLRVKFNGKLKILSRITFACSDPAKTHIVAHSATLKKYNLYAFAPKTQNALQFACSQLNADLITFRPSLTTLKLNKKLYDQAIERGIHFEIQYSDILNSEWRKLAIHYSHLFHTYGKSRNVILSSGANDVHMIRNPYDVINLSFVLGLNELKAKSCILHQCRILVLKAERRRCGKAVFVVETEEDTVKSDENDSGFVKRIKL